jgi:hypothetical protein
MDDSFVKSKRDFNVVLEAGLRVSVASKGVEVDEAGLIADKLLARNVTTAFTIQMIINPPVRTGGSGMPEKFQIWDMSSLCVLARGIIETYLALAYMIRETESPDGRGFRLLWWNWHENNERLWLLQVHGSKNPEVNNIRSRRDEAARKILNCKQYGSLSTQLKKKFGKGDGLAPALLESNLEIAKAAGIHPSQFKIAYKYLSQFAHSQPMAISIGGVSKANDPKVLEQFGLPLRYATSYLLFTIRDFVRLFPIAYNAAGQEFWALEAVWSGVHTTDMASVDLDS